MPTEVKISSLRKGMAVDVRFTNGHRVSGRYVARDTDTITVEQTGTRYGMSDKFEGHFKRDMIERIYRDVR